LVASALRWQLTTESGISWQPATICGVVSTRD